MDYDTLELKESDIGTQLPKQEDIKLKVKANPK